MNPFGIAWIQIETFSHATEDIEKVKSLLSKFFSFDITFNENKTYGHFGNEITIINVELSKNKEIKDFISNFLTIVDKNYILETLEKRLDEDGVLFVRMGKERVFNDDFTIDDNGDILLSMKFVTYPKSREKVIKNGKLLFSN
ncbi:MAG: RNA-binding domain-containing protein [Methanofastidiosum sp.]